MEKITKNEINFLFDLIRKYIKKNIKKIVKQGIKVNIIGKKKDPLLNLPPGISLNKVETTKLNKLKNNPFNDSLIDIKTKLRNSSSNLGNSRKIRRTDPVCQRPPGARSQIRN